MQLKYVIICSSQPRFFARVLAKIFDGQAYYASETCYTCRIFGLPEVRIETGNAGDMEKWHLSLCGSRAELTEKLKQCNSSLISGDKVDFWKIFDDEGSLLGCISVMDD